MNYVLVLRQKSSEEGPDDPDNVLVLRQKPSEGDRMIRMILNDVVFLIIGIRCLQKLSSSEEARISISFLSRYPCPSYDFSRPPVSTDTEEH